MRGSDGEGWKRVVVKGVCFICRVVRRGFGFGGVGWRWCRERVELGPEERRSGSAGCISRQVIADCGIY